MDPMTFATIIGLLSDFVSHRRDVRQTTLEEFTDWLSERRHDEIVVLLKSTSMASIGTKALLNETREVLLSRLTAIDQALVSYASAVEGFAQLAEAASPSSRLSEQAISILKQIDQSGASKVLEMHSSVGVETKLIYFDATQKGEVKIADQRFLQDDLACLERLSLLRTASNSNGGRFFLFTRAAASLVRNNGA